MFRLLERSKIYWAMPLIFFKIFIQSGCDSGRRRTSDVMVSNGILTSTQEFPFVVRLDLSNGGVCTGTFITSSAVLTAAHCLTNSPFVVTQGISSKQIIINKNSQLGSSSEDLGFVLFPENPAQSMASIIDRAVRPGETISLVGYGNNFYTPDGVGSEQGTGSGIRRKGRNIVAAVGGGIINISGNYDNSATGMNSICGSGDSGGPLLINGEIAGVASTRTAGVMGGAPTCAYVDLRSPQAVDFIRRATAAGLITNPKSSMP